MSYESFRSKLMSKLSDVLPVEQLRVTLEIIDSVGASYDIEQKNTDIIPYDGGFDAMKIYIASKVLEGRSKKTLYTYKLLISNFLKAVRKPLDSITPNDIRGYLYNLKEINGVSMSYVETVRRVLNCFFVWLRDNEYINSNPARLVKKINYNAEQHFPISMVDIEKTRLGCKDIREKAIIDFLFTTGCRVSECVAVNLSDIDWSSRSVIIRHGKGDKTRTVFFDSETEVSLKTYLDTRKVKSEALFSGNYKCYERIGKRTVEKIVKRACENAGVEERCTPHTLRRTFATVSLASGMPLERLQALMGHSKPETTMIYAKLDKADLQVAHRKVFI